MSRDLRPCTILLVEFFNRCSQRNSVLHTVYKLNLLLIKALHSYHENNVISLCLRKNPVANEGIPHTSSIYD